MTRRESIKVLKEDYELHYENETKETATEGYLQIGKALSEAIKALEAQEEALEELGEKLDDFGCFPDTEYPMGFNDCHDIASKIIAKDRKEIAELKEAIKDDWINNVKPMKSMIVELQEKIKELEKSKEILEDHIYQYIK